MRRLRAFFEQMARRRQGRRFLSPALRLLVIGAFLITTAFPYTHAFEPGHENHPCQLCLAVTHSAVLLPLAAEVVLPATVTGVASLPEASQCGRQPLSRVTARSPPLGA